MEVDQPAVYQTTMPSVLSEVAAMYQPFVDKLFDDDVVVVKQGCSEIKDLVIGNNKQKTNFIVLGAVPRLVYLIKNDDTSVDIKTQCAIILGSLAKGIEANVKHLIDYDVITAMCNGLCSLDLKLYEASIRCLRSIIIASCDMNINPDVVMPQLLENINKSTCTQVCTCEIISHCFKSTEQQNQLLGLGAIGHLTTLVNQSEIPVVQVSALKSLSVLCYKNSIICEQIADTKVSGISFVDYLVSMLARDNSKDKQLYAATCLTYIFRSGVIDINCCNGVLPKRVLPCLIRMCSLSVSEKISGARTVAYLTELDPNLQRLSFICDQYPLKLESFFKNPTVKDTKNPTEMFKFKNELKYQNELRSVGFLGYASLLSNDEDIRKQVVNDTLVKHVSEALNDSLAPLRIAALRCLLSLSRSVHLLRTCIQDAHIGSNLENLLKNSNKSMEESIVLSSILANFTLVFCPDKEELISSCNAMQYMCEWVCSDVDALRINGIWGLMNMMFRADINLKLKVLEALGFDRIKILLGDKNREVIVKTLGCLRNILENPKDSAAVMTRYGYEIVTTCLMVLETFSEYGTGDPSLHEEYELIRMHAVCVLCSTMASSENNSYLGTNQKLLQHIINYLGQFHLGLQKASVAFVYNLVKSRSGTIERQNVLTKLNILSALEQLKSTTDKTLSELVVQTLQMFEG